MLDPEILGEGLAEIVRDAVAAAVAPLKAEIATLRSELSVDSAKLIDELIAQSKAAAQLGADLALQARPAPRDGKDAEPVSDAQIANAVRLHLEANPPPAGRDGVDGVDGKDGRDGADGAPGEAGAAGDPGRDGKDGRDGLDGKAGVAGLDGKDGVGLAGAMIDRDGALVITLTNGEQRALGQVVGRDGVDGAKGDPGQAGRDGFGLTDFDTQLSADGRLLTLSLESGDLKVTHELELGGMIYRGVHKDGEAYVRGDTVTWASQIWHCNQATTDKPGDGNSAWTLAVRKGRDGKDGLPGAKGERGETGRPGRDLTQLGADGSKW